jgi:hypothetical protein
VPSASSQIRPVHRLVADEHRQEDATPLGTRRHRRRALRHVDERIVSSLRRGAAQVAGRRAIAETSASIRPVALELHPLEALELVEEDAATDGVHRSVHLDAILEPT